MTPNSCVMLLIGPSRVALITLKKVHTGNIGFITHNLSGLHVIVHVHNVETYASTKLRCYNFSIQNLWKEL
jgi:hypothetical protein